MRTLSQTLLANDERREHLIADCVLLIEQRVACRGPVRRIALSTAIALLNAIKPGALPRALGSLLPEFAAALDPLYARFRQSEQRDFSPFLEAHSAEATAALIAVTERRIAASNHAGVRSTYARLRGMAEGEVRAALPALARILDDHLARNTA